MEFGNQISISDEWNKGLQIAAIDRYLESRQEYLTQSEKFFSIDFDEFNENAEEDKLLDYHLRIMSILQYMGGDLSQIIDKIIFLALHDDSEVKSCGSIFLLRVADRLSSYLPEVLQIMGKHGSWERPFKVGKALNKIIDRNPELIDKLVL